MPWVVTIQMPIETADGSIHLYRLPDQEIATPPHKGLLLSGRRVPQIMGPESDISTIVVQVCEDLEARVVFLNCQGYKAATQDHKEVLQELQELNRNWGHVPQALHAGGQRAEEGPGQDYEPPSSDAGGAEGYNPDNWN